MPNPGAQTRQGEPHSGVSSLQDPGNGLVEERGDPEPAGTPNHQQRLEHIVSRAALQDKVRGSIPAPIPAPLPTTPFLGCQTLPGSTGIWIFSPVSFNSPAQLRVSRQGSAGTGVNWIWVTFWMRPGKFSWWGEGRAEEIWAKIAEFGLCGKAAWKSCSGMIPPWASLGSRRSRDGSLALPLSRAQLPALACV